MKRNQLIDSLRGITIISMVLFHLFYNINYYISLDFYDGTVFNRVWQLSIALSFFIISGISSNYLSPRSNLIRGIKTSLIGFLISIVTYIFAKDQFILWGVLNGLGISMIIGSFLAKYIKNWAFPLFILAFVFTYKIQSVSLLGTFDFLYEKNLFFLGFPGPGFKSTDYFPIIPWTLAYLGGISLGKYLFARDFFNIKMKDNILAKIGRHSLIIYLAHQVILYPLVSLIFS